MPVDAVRRPSGDRDEQDAVSVGKVVGLRFIVAVDRQPVYAVKGAVINEMHALRNIDGAEGAAREGFALNFVQGGGEDQFGVPPVAADVDIGRAPALVKYPEAVLVEEIETDDLSAVIRAVIGQAKYAAAAVDAAVRDLQDAEVRIP